MTRKQRLARGTVAALSAALIGSVGLMTPALADDATTVGNIDPNAPASLTIVKYAGLPVDELANDGQQLAEGDEPDLDPLEGVVFTVTRLGLTGEGTTCQAIDLTTNAGWDVVDDVKAGGLDRNGFCAFDTFTLTTNAEGVASKDLDLGLYYVAETGSGANNIVQAVEPFFVTLPYPTTVTSDEDGTSHFWNYDVWVYPKNQLADTPIKTITERPDHLIVGSIVTWNITTVIPATEEDLKDVVLYDTLDPRLGYASSVLQIVPVKDDDEAIALVAGDDYVVSGAESGNVTWDFTPAGVAKVNANSGATITTELKTTVKTAGNGSIPNDVYGVTWTNDQGVKTKVSGKDVPFTYWGQLEVIKTDKSDPARKLSGAEFSVTEKKGETCEASLGSQAVVASGASDATGVVQWTDDKVSSLGLWILNSNTATANPTKSYCLYEVKAPAGYTAAAVTEVVITPNGGAAAKYTVANVQKSGPELPLTGARGTLVLAGLGLLLVGGGSGIAIRSRRREALDI